MAEEGTLALARAQDLSGEKLSKEELQHRMDDARESISQTVTDIKDTVVQQYESVKETISETLDWREQFKKRPGAWAAGAVGAGFLTGYCVTSMMKGGGNNYEGYEQSRYDYQPVKRHSYAAKSVAAAPAAPEEEPGLLAKIQDTQAYDRLKSEASTIGGNLVDEVSKTAKEILVPAAVGLIRHWLERLIPQKAAQSPSREPYVAPTASQGVSAATYSR